MPACVIDRKTLHNATFDATFDAGFDAGLDMADVTRRMFLGACAVGAAAVSTRPFTAGATPPLPAARASAPGILTRLPGEGNQLALTVDDGCSTSDVAAIGRFCADSGMRLTFFVN